MNRLQEVIIIITEHVKEIEIGAKQESNLHWNIVQIQNNRNNSID